MVRTADDVLVPSGGDVYQAPMGTALPTTLVTPPPAPWENIGFLSDDNPPAITGLTREATDLFAWNVDTPLRSALAPAAPLITAELLQPESDDALMLFFGGGTWTSGAGAAPDTYEAPALSTPLETATIIDVVDGNKLYRMMFPRTQTRANGDMALARGGFVAMPIAMSILTPSSGPWLKVLVAKNTPIKGAAKPGDVFPAEATVTASDATNAAKLAGLGYVASPTSNWTAGQKITVGTFDFNWSGTAWAAGAHAVTAEGAKSAKRSEPDEGSKS
jgi:hypothetical protein